jgi:putative spermidine/putrescine transport system substrate-binding protein
MDEQKRLDQQALTRRELLKRGAAAGAGLAVAPAAFGYAARGAAAAEKTVTLTFTSFGGAYQDAQTKGWLAPFMKAHPNIKIVQDQPTDYSKIKAQADAHDVTWDVVDVGNDFGLERNKDILMPIDAHVVKNAHKALPGVINSPYRVADMIYGVVMAYRTDKMPQGRVPAGWHDFFDTKAFPGKRGLWKFVSGGLLEFALVADGVSPHKLYPLDVKRAFKKLDTIKKQIVWWDTGAQSAQLLADGEVTIGHSWNGRIFDIQKQGAKVAIQWNQAFQTQDFLVVPKGTKHPKEAMQLIDYITSCAHSAQLSRYIAYAPAYACAVPNADPTKKNDLPTTYNSKALFFNDRWWDKNFSTVDKKFQSWLQS